MVAASIRQSLVNAFVEVKNLNFGRVYMRCMIQKCGFKIFEDDYNIFSLIY